MVDKGSLDQYNEEFLTLMNAPAGTTPEPPVADPLFSEALMSFVDIAHIARLAYVRFRASRE